jgi:hypothetical protein
MATGKLPRKQEAALAALLLAPTIAAAAEAAGCDERTLRRWIQEPAFAAAYRRARAALVEHAAAKLQRLCDRAADTLEAALDADRAADRIRAAGVILDRAARFQELQDLAERLAALEQYLAARKGEQ